MPRSFDLSKLRSGLPRSVARDPRFIARVVLGVLLLANIVTALLVFKPWSGSTEDLENQAAGLSQQIRATQTSLEKLRTIVSKVQTARTQGDEFEQTYFTATRTASSAMESELNRAAQESGMKQKERVFADEPIEGTDTLFAKTVNASFEGTFADLMQLINSIDRSPRFLILESLTAAPQQAGLLLNVNLKLTGFVRESAGDEADSATVAQAGTSEVAQR